MDNAIPFEDALNARFESSTREELVHYCSVMGLDKVDPKAPMGTLKDALLANLGFSHNSDTRSPARAVPQSSVVPPVNLTPNGRWGGRRRRISLPRPEGAKLARAEGFGWNGKATYWLPYDEVVAVPYPIYMMLIETMRPRPKRIETRNPDGTTEITTGWDHIRRPISDVGDDPATAHLPASMTEWYQDKGQSFYKKLGSRDLRTVAQRLEATSLDVDRKPLPHEELLSNVLVFLFGYADSDTLVDEREAAAAEA